MAFSTIFFDLDDTLYPPTSGVWEAIGVRIERFIELRLGVPHDEVAPLRERLYHTYGTTLRGLVVTRGIDPADYLAYVHDILLKDYIAPDPRVRQMLERYPQRKVIFTNADRAHAGRVLDILGLADIFDQIIDVLDVAPHNKPMPEAFRKALELAGIRDASQCILLDDAPRNLDTARAEGFYTVYVGPRSVDGCCNAAIPALLDAPKVLDKLLLE